MMYIAWHVSSHNITFFAIAGQPRMKKFTYAHISEASQCALIKQESENKIRSMFRQWQVKCDSKKLE